MHIITPSFCVEDNYSCFLHPSLSDLTTNGPSCNQTNLKNSTVKPSEPGLVLVFIFFNAKLASSSEISSSSELRYSTFTFGYLLPLSDISQYSTALSVYKF